MKFLKETTRWLGHQGNKLFIPTRNPAVRMQEKALWMRFSKNSVDVAFALRSKDLDTLLGTVGDSLTCKKEWDDLKTLSKFIEGNDQLEIADIGNDEFHIYHNNGEWYKIRVESNGYTIFFFDKDDHNHMKFCAMSLGAVLMNLHKYLSEKEIKKLIDENNNDDEMDDNYDDQMIEKGVVGWCEETEGVAIKLAVYNDGTSINKDFPDFIIILNKQYVYKLKLFCGRYSLFLMPHSKQENFLLTGTEEKIIEYLQETLKVVMSN